MRFEPGISGSKRNLREDRGHLFGDPALQC
jgi:hypothetical protein